MPTIAAADGQTLEVSVDDFTTISNLLGHLGAGRLRSLLDLADSLLTGERVFEDRTTPDPAPPGSERLYNISCRARVTAQCYGQRQPSCRWVRDGAAYSCKACGGTVGPGMARHTVIARQFGDVGVSEAPADLHRWWIRVYVAPPTAVPREGQWWITGYTSEAAPRMIVRGLVDAAGEIEARAHVLALLGPEADIVAVDERARDWAPSGRYM